MALINTIKDFERQNREALYALLHVDELQEDYMLAQKNMNFMSGSSMDGQPHGTKIGNPTQSRVMRLIDIERKKKWLMAVEQCEELLSKRKNAFLNYRRMADINARKEKNIGRKGWINYTQCKLLEWDLRNGDASKAKPVPKTTLLEWQRKIVNMLVRIALSLGCYDF